MIPLARDSHIALYRQLAGQLRAAIARGDYAQGGKLPTEPQLIRRFRVSREGLVIRKQGKGTFVAGPLVHHDLLDLRGLYDGLVAQGLEPSTRVLDLQRAIAPARVAARLGSASRKLLHSRRLFLTRGEPLAVAVVYLNTGRARLSREQVERNPTYSILENLLAQRIARADVAIRYERASAELARPLGIAKGAPVMVFERVSYNAEGVPLEHSLYHARAEAYEFSLTVRGKLPITSSLKMSK